MWRISEMAAGAGRSAYVFSLIELSVLMAVSLVLAGVAWGLVLRLHESQAQLQDLAIRDPLTGLYNRRYFREVYAAEILRASARSVDVLARYGGDEFVILMPITPRENAATAINRLERNLVQWRWPGAPHGLHVSVGMSTWDTSTKPLEEADTRMYQAKKARALVELLQRDA